MLSAPSVHERRMYYKEFIKVMCEYIGNVMADKQDDRTANMKNVESLQRLERLHGLERLQGLEGLEAMMADYRNVNLPANATIYADPPYRNTGEHYGGFDFDAFDNWLMTVDHPVYVSEFDAPKGCVCIAERERHDHLAAYTSAKRIERIFVQERFVNANQN